MLLEQNIPKNFKFIILFSDLKCCKSEPKFRNEKWGFIVNSPLALFNLPIFKIMFSYLETFFVI